MRKLFSFISTTLDGYHEGPNQEFDFWTVDEAFLAFSVNQLREVGVLLLGRPTRASPPSGPAPRPPRCRPTLPS